MAKLYTALPLPSVGARLSAEVSSSCGRLSKALPSEPGSVFRFASAFWIKVVATVYGAALTIRATMKPLKASRGHLLLTGSVAGRRAMPGSLYSATKWAVTGMGESARQDFNGTGVRVTLIEPGKVDTPFFDQRPEGALQPDDVARAVLFAVSQPPHVDVNEILIRPTEQEG